MITPLGERITHAMKSTAYGYAKRTVSENGLVELTEVTLVGTPSELRRIAAFIALGADAIEKHGAKFGHEHLQDQADLKPRWDDSAVDLIVVARNPEGGKNVA
jgi:hypothetical protein